MANNAAAILFLPPGVVTPITPGAGNCRTPHFGQISALALMTDPQSVQNFSLAALDTGIDILQPLVLDAPYYPAE
jgi:hypothetical protein